MANGKSFIFVHHKDTYPKGNEAQGVDKVIKRKGIEVIGKRI